jgi:hydrogenase maturation protease
MRYILGLGNYAMGDDSIGLRIIEHIADNNLEDGFEAIEIGNNGMNVLTYFEEDTEQIVVVDAVDFGGNPGDCISFSPDEVESKKIVGNVSTHEGDILKLIELAKQIGQPIPPIRILAVQPKNMKMSDCISPELQGNFDKYVEQVIQEIKQEQANNA